MPPGWDKWYTHIAEGTKYYDYQLNENGEVVAYDNEEEDYATDVMARKATEYIERTADNFRPFFMHLSPSAPHDPYTPAPRHEGEFADTQKPHTPSFNESDLGGKPSWLRDSHALSPTKVAQIDEEYRAHLRMMLLVEEVISGVVEAQEATGEFENTYIVFTSDNGYHIGEHRRRGKETAYQEDVHVPLFVRGPEVPGGGGVHPRHRPRPNLCGAGRGFRPGLRRRPLPGAAIK